MLVDALYGGRQSQYIETQVKFEDGRTGSVAADLKIVDAKTCPATGARTADTARQESRMMQASVTLPALRPVPRKRRSQLQRRIGDVILRRRRTSRCASAA